MFDTYCLVILKYYQNQQPDVLNVFILTTEDTITMMIQCKKIVGAKIQLAMGCLILGMCMCMWYFIISNEIITQGNLHCRL